MKVSTAVAKHSTTMMTVGSNQRVDDDVASSKAQRREWLALVTPWAGLALSAIVAALMVVLVDDSHEDKVDDWNMMRQLHTDDGYVPPTDEFTYAKQTSLEHHHKPVYNEEHAPLFPLTGRDYAGFILAILGLMIAVRQRKKTVAIVPQKFGFFI